MPGPRPLRPTHSPMSGPQTCGRVTGSPQPRPPGAGPRLAARLGHLRGEPVVVLGLPRGGVPVAFQVARALGAPLDVIVVRKLGVPFQPELGMGAVGEDGARVINPEIIDRAGV